MIYNVFIAGVQQSDSVMHIHASILFFMHLFFFKFFSHLGYHKILCIVPCAIQEVLAGYLVYVQECVSVNQAS